MADIEVMNEQPEFLGIIDDSKSYLYEELWKLCAGSLSGFPKSGDKIYYFPQGHIEQLEAYTKESRGNNKPVFDIPPKIQCNVVRIRLEAEKDTDDVYAKITLFPDIVQAGIHIPNENQQRPKFYFFTKILTESDINPNGGFSVPKKHATECLPPLDISLPTPTQELVAKDLHGHEWRFKHIFRVTTPKRHLFTTGWSTFVKAKRLVAGDSFVFLRGENGESRVGVRRASHQQDNMLSSIISTQNMYHGIVAYAVNAVNSHCNFTVIYKPRSSNFLVSYNKYVDAMNNKFNVGSRFLMRFEGENFSERSYSGTIDRVRNLSPHWKNSDWRALEVKWDECATISRPDKVSPWEIEHLAPSSYDPQSIFLKKKHFDQINEIGSTTENPWIPTLTQCQEIGQSSLSPQMSVSQPFPPGILNNPHSHYGLPMNYSVPTINEPNYNNEMFLPMKKKITTDTTSSCRLFGVDLKIHTETKDPMDQTHLYQKSKDSKLFEEKKLHPTQTMTSSKEVQSKQINYTRSHTEVHMHGVAMSRVVNLTSLDGYNELIEVLEKLFNLKGGLQGRDQWEIVLIDNKGDVMFIGDHTWPEFCSMVNKILIFPKEDVNKMKLKEQSL